MKYLFLFLAFMSIFSALMVVFSRNVVYSVLFLIVTFFSIAGIYIFSLNAQFLGAVQVIVYAGAIMVLFLFTIMMLNLNKESEPLQSSTLIRFAGVIAGGMLLILMVASFKGAAVTGGGSPSQVGLIKNLGKVLFNDFKLPLEVASILFLAAMVGAVMIGKKEIN